MNVTLNSNSFLKEKITLKKIQNKTNICLYGPPGAGKTTTSKILGQRLKMDVYDVDDDHLEKDWNMPVSEKLKMLGDEKFIEAEGESVMKIEKENTIISLTGSVPLNEKAILKLKETGIIVYLDIDSQEILKRCEKMKVSRIVGQNTKTLPEILEWRKQIYEKYYDLRVIIGQSDSPEIVCDEIIKLLNAKEERFISTRQDKPNLSNCVNFDDKLFFSFEKVIEKGLAPDNGLFLPLYFPYFKLNQLERLINMNYEERCLRILESFPIGKLTPQELRKYIEEAYSSFYDKRVLPIKKLNEKLFVMEEFCGPTASFKDLAFQLFPKLFKFSTQNKNQKDVILVATSGDTGSAVLDGFRRSNTPVVVLYPYAKVGPIQEKQMNSNKGQVLVLCVNSDFDFCQKIIKRILNDSNLTQELREKFNVNLSSGNSINWGRLFPQIMYCINSYLELVKNNEIQLGERIDVCIPTGNFGNILGAFIAKKIGLPLDNLICASDENNIITEIINQGKFDLRDKELKATISPSIDILNPSNIERILYLLTNDNKLISDFYSDLDSKKHFELESELLIKIQQEFVSEYTDEKHAQNLIKEIFDEFNYVIDPHTAVAFATLNKLNKKINLSNKEKKVIISATADYAKFLDVVFNSLSDEKLDFDKMNYKDEDLICLFEKLENIIKGSAPRFHPAIKELLSNSDHKRNVLDADYDLVVQKIKEFLDNIQFL